ncbi:MAG: PAS sensor protein [Anaerolineae bacterium]|nr:MAG: PAS sensor protein [Anaerolineae bacterium]
MSRESVLSLVNNAALLLALALLYQILPLRKKGSPVLQQLLTGSLIGGISIVIMLTPWQFTSGVIFDTRSVLLSLSGLYFGFLPTLMAALIASLFRLYLGGPGAFTGVGSIVISAALGYLWRASLRKNQRSNPHGYELYAFGWVVHLAILVWFLTLPAGLAIPAIRAVSLPFLIIYPFATLLLGLLFNLSDERVRMEQALTEKEALFSAAFHTTPLPMTISRLKDGIILDVNRSFCEYFGLSPQEIIGRSFLEIERGMDAEVFQDISQKIQYQGEIENFPLQVRLKNGEMRQMLYSAVTITIQNEPCLINVGTDVTDLIEKQNALEQRLKELQVLNGVALATVKATNEDELISQVTQILSTELYREHCGILLLDRDAGLLRPHPSYFVNPPHSISSLPLGKGGAGQAIQRGVAILVSDPQTKAEDYVLTSVSRSLLAVPIQIGTEMFGVVNIESRRTHAFTEADQQLLSTIADQLAGAIERLHAQQREAHQRRIAEALASTAIAINSHLDLESVFKQLLHNVRRVIPCDAANITLLDGDETRVVYLEGYETYGDPGWTLNSRLNLSATPNYQEMIRTKAPLLISDTHASPFWRVFREGEWIASYLAAPICVEGEVIGFLNLDHHQAHFFTSEHAQILGAFAEHAAIAIRNARLFDELKRRLNELEAINRVSLALRAAHTPEQLLPLLLDEALQLFQTPCGAIWLVDKDQQRVRRIIARGWMNENGVVELSIGEGLAGSVVEQGKPQYFGDSIATASTPSNLKTTFPPGWGGVCFPIASTTEVIGCLCVGLPSPRSLSEQDGRILSTLAEIAAIALQRAQLLADLQHETERLASLREIDYAISVNTEFYPMAEVILRQTRQHLGLDAVQIWEFEPNLARLELVVAQGLRKNPPVKNVYQLGEGLAGTVALTLHPLTISDLQQWSAVNSTVDCQHYLEEGFLAYIGLPILVKGRLGGVIELCQRSPLTSLTAQDPQWLSFAKTIASQTALAMENAHLFRDLNNTLMELSLSYDETLEGWAKALELRDRETAGHSDRVTEWTLNLALALGVEKDQLIHIRRGAILHDIGKIGVPDTILLKEGPLTPQEWQIIRQHPVFAYELLRHIRFLQPALDIPYCHHEKWDGSGYPRGLKGEEIPLAARIFAVVDVWDALTSDRPYRKAWSQAEAREYLRSQAGKHFDPRVVAAFLQLLEQQSSASSTP